jgi:uncharacterized integral membrane protein (TIGR00698 family)
MNLRTLFFGEVVIIHRNEFWLLIRESLPGLAIVAMTGFVSYLLTHMPQFGLPIIPYMQFIDTLVLAVVLGMFMRLAIMKTSLLNWLTPGILLAPIIFIPLGIILYGMTFRVDQMSHLHGFLILKVLLTLLISVLLIYFLSVNIFKLSHKLAYLLGIGSVICGASAIAITSPVVEADPDEMGTALVTNTLLALISLIILKSIVAWISPQLWAATAGAFLQQTGFVKLAVSGKLQEYALLVKTLRVSLLLVIVPLTYYLNYKKIYFPWYMLLFVGVGLWYSFAAPGKDLTNALKTTYDISFTLALTSIGMNANIIAVTRKIWKPLLVTSFVFCLGVALFILSSR